MGRAAPSRRTSTTRCPFSSSRHKAACGMRASRFTTPFRPR
jgi:hypothetical protein